MWKERADLPAADPEGGLLDADPQRGHRLRAGVPDWREPPGEEGTDGAEGHDHDHSPFLRLLDFLFALLLRCLPTRRRRRRAAFLGRQQYLYLRFLANSKASHWATSS